MAIGDVRTLRTEALKSREPGLSGAVWIGISPIDGLTANQVQHALEQLAARADVPPASETERGKVEEATTAQVQAGTVGVLYVPASKFKAELDRRQTPEAWISPTLLNGWVNYGAPFGAAGYYKDPLGRVHLRGVVKGGTANTPIFNLPAGYRPATDGIFGTESSVADARVDVEAAGAVKLKEGANAYVALDPISFRAEQ